MGGRARARRRGTGSSPQWDCRRPPASPGCWRSSGWCLVVRSALIPLFVKQIKSQRKMMEIAPELRKVQEKYKGKKDQLSREAMSRETMALYKKHGTNPASSCLPLLVQMPVFFALFSVLNGVTIKTDRSRHRRCRAPEHRAHRGVLQREAVRCRLAARHARRRLGSSGARMAGHGRHPARCSSC